MNIVLSFLWRRPLISCRWSSSDRRSSGSLRVTKIVKSDITVLVVDDLEPVRELVCEVLGFAGYRTLSAESGQEALEAARSHVGTIELLISDCSLPGMSGSEVFEALAKTRPGIRALFISGHHDVVLPA